MKRAVFAVAFFAVLLLLWEWATRTGHWSPVILPSPMRVADYLKGAVLDGTLWESVRVTMARLLLGYFIGVALGLPIGLLCASSRYAQDTFGAMALGFQTLPSVCWIPLALLWFGQSETAMLFVVVMGTMWSVSLATDLGARTIPAVYEKAARTMGSSGFHKWTRVILPASLPFLVNGMKQGWAFAWRSLMAAEIYVTVLSGFGLGQLLHYGRELNAMDQVIGVMLIIVLIGLAADKILFAPWERFVNLRWGAAAR